MERFENGPLAIIGMACRLPGASNLDEYWKLLIEGRSAISRVPDDRLDRNLYYNSRKGTLGRTYVDQAGTIDYPAYDQSRCPYPVRLMRYVDVGHLMMCQVAADACRQGGLDPFAIRDRNAGVYIGNNCSGTLAAEISYTTLVAEAAEYLHDIEAFRSLTGERAGGVVAEVIEKIRRGRPRISRHGSLNVGFHVVANAVSEVLGLNGPSMVLDAACSSSLKALALAARDLWLGNTEMAIVGGASYCTTDGLIIFSAAQAGSEKNGCCPFSDRSDGLVSAEGYAAIVVKTLERALADGDPIQSVVTGIGISSDGAGKTLWAPRQEGQAKAVERAYGSGADMSRISYVEAHATSTAVGDQTELEAMQAAFGERRRGLGKIQMGGVKANIGHVLEPAGLAGLIKTTLVLQHEVAPAQINCLPLNSKVDWDALPFYIPTTNERLPRREDGQLRQAAINAFGIGGLNAHVVLEEFVDQRSPVASGDRRLPALPISATTARIATTSSDRVTEPIAIIGVGTLLPGARTWEAFGELIFSGADPKTTVPGSRWNIDAGRELAGAEEWTSPAKQGGFITDFEYDWRRHRLPPKVLKTANPLQFMILDCFDAAIVDASYDKKPFDRETTGVLVGANFESEFASQLCLGFRLPHFQQQLEQVLVERGFGSVGDFQKLLAEFEKKVIERMPALIDDSGSFTPSSLCSRLTKTYNLMGGAGTIDTGDSVGLGAVAQAINALRTGACSMMACAVGSRDMGLSTFLQMSCENDLAQGQTRSTLDRHANGQLPGEGAGLILLKRLSDAQRDGDAIRGVIHGIGAGFSADPHEAFTQAISRAWRGVAVSPDAVQMIELSAAPANVAPAELAALKEQYGQSQRSTPMIVGAAAAQFGNSMGMAGMTSLLKAGCQLQRRAAPAQFGLETPCDELAGDKPSLAAAMAPLTFPASSDEEPFLAGVSSWDICGSAYHLILGRGAPVPTVLGGREVKNISEAAQPSAARLEEGFASSSPLRTIRLGAESSAELLANVEQGLSSVDELYAQAEGNRPFEPNQRHRLAIIAESPTELAGQLRLVADQGPASRVDLMARKSIFLGEVRSQPLKIAFLFPGQGSQHADMLQTLVSDFAQARQVVRELDAELATLGYPSWTDLVSTNGQLLGQNVFRTQLSLLVADTIVHRSLGALGIIPDCVAGHSFGEFPALLAAGVWTFAEAARATKARCDAITACDHIAGGMLSTNADAETTHDVCVEAKVEAYVANVNAPDQTTIGGTAESLEVVRQRLSERGFACRVIPVNRPFHTPLMQDVQEPLRCGLKEIPTRSPQLPILSSVTNEFVQDGREVVENLVAQMTRPVRYPELVKRLADEGATAFIECGPRNILTGLHGKIGLGADAICIAADQLKVNGYRQLLSVRASFEVRGALGVGEMEQSSSSERSSLSARPLPNSDHAKWGTCHAKGIQALLRAEVSRGFADQPNASLSDAQLTEIREIARGARVGWQALAAFCRRNQSASQGNDSICEVIEQALRVRAALPESAMATSHSAGRTHQVDPSLFKTVTAAEFSELATPQGSPLPGMGDRKCHRFEMRVLEKPVGEVDWSRLRFHGKALIVGDNDASRELSRLIAAHGGSAEILSTANGVDQALEDLQRLCQESPLPHLYLMTGQDADAVTDLTESAWNRRREVGMILPFLVTSRWFQLVSAAKLVERASIHAATSMGGDLGFSGQSRNVEGGAVAGLVKSLIHEAGVPTNFAFQTTLVDFAGDQPPAQVAKQLLAEVAVAAPFELEIGYVGERRFVVRPIPAEAPQALADAHPPAGVWVATGGGRGITAYVAQRLAKQYGLKLHLIGSSPAPDLPPHWRGADESATREIRNEVFRQAKTDGKPPAAEWRKTLRMLDLDKTLQEMADNGVDAVYHQCDVSDRQALAATLTAIRNADGPISGILHGAGIEVSSRLESKSPELVRKTLAVKAESAAALIDLTRNDPVRHFIGFGSVTARVGCPGQADYAMANEALAKLLNWHRTQRPDCAVTCFDWGPWDEIGMAMRPETRGNPVLSGLTAVPPAEGVEFVLAELNGDSTASEAMIVGWDVYKIFYISNTPEAQPKATPALPQRNAAATDALPPSATRMAPAASPVDLPDHEIRRMVLRWVDCPGNSSAAPIAPVGKAMILGDNADAAALADLLRRTGISVAHFKEPISDASDDHAQAVVERCWRHQAVTHLFVCTARDPEAARIDDPEAWQARARGGLIGPSRLISAWLKKATAAGTLADSTLVGLTSLGGDCGFASGPDAIEGAGISGILKAAHAEHGGPDRDGLKVKVIDAPVNEAPCSLAESVVKELSCDPHEIEVAFVDGQRRVPRLINQTTSDLPPRPPRRGATWVVTGGARGITAEVVRALGKKYGLKLHLLGTRPLPKLDESIRYLSDEELKPHKREIVRQAIREGQKPEEAWGPVRRDFEIDRNLRLMASEGIDVTYHQCDVADSRQLAETFAEVRRLSGPIAGLIHGAGIQGVPASVRDMIETSIDTARKTIAIKCTAMLEMLRLTENDPLEHCVGFGSISGRFGSNSAAFYSAGTDMLCKLMGRLRRQRPQCRAVGFHWHGWADVGMITRPEGLGTAKILKLELLSPEDGVAYLVNELEAGTPECEVVITNPKYFVLYHSRDILLPHDPAKSAPAPLVGETALPKPAGTAQETAFPLIATLQRVDGQQSQVAVATLEFDPARDPFLVDHRFQQRPLLPAVIVLESFLEAAQSAAPGSKMIAVHDLQLHAGLKFNSDRKLTAQVRVEQEQRQVRCQLTADFRNRQGEVVDADRMHASAVVEISHRNVALERLYRPCTVPWHTVWYPEPTNLMYHGPTFQLLQRCAFDESGEVWGDVTAADVASLAGDRGAAGWNLHPALVDAALYLCGVTVWVNNNQSIALPHSLDCLQLGRLPRANEKCLVHLQPRESNERQWTFDVVCYGDDRSVLFAMQGYRCQIVMNSHHKSVART